MNRLTIASAGATAAVNAVEALPGEHLGQALNLDRPHRFLGVEWS
jgi:hypothetical protein